MASYLLSLGGEIQTNAPVACVDDLPPSRVVLLDVTPRQVLRLAGHRLPTAYRRQLARYRYGPGVFKMDWALDAPIPWRAETCKRAATVHLGGTLRETAGAERAAFNGQHSERPFVILAQPSLFDDTRAPAHQHTAWAYCHVPHGSTLDVSEYIESQIERFRARIPGARAGPPRHGARSAGTLQCQLRGRRHQRRRAGLAPAFHAARRAVDALRDAGQTVVYLFRLNAPRRAACMAWAAPSPRRQPCGERCNEFAF